ncbi:MAG: hypothetical protein SFT93_05925 [Rickettsiaceae bacterium]|nr:hypothetical protein [Rickettsiaceae bacterium]
MSKSAYINKIRNLNLTDEQKLSILSDKCYFNDYAHLEWFFEACGDDVIDITYKNGQLFEIAISKGYDKILKELLSYYQKTRLNHPKESTEYKIAYQNLQIILEQSYDGSSIAPAVREILENYIKFDQGSEDVDSRSESEVLGGEVQSEDFEDERSKIVQDINYGPLQKLASKEVMLDTAYRTKIRLECLNADPVKAWNKFREGVEFPDSSSRNKTFYNIDTTKIAPLTLENLSVLGYKYWQLNMEAEAQFANNNTQKAQAIITQAAKLVLQTPNREVNLLNKAIVISNYIKFTGDDQGKICAPQGAKRDVFAYYSRYLAKGAPLVMEEMQDPHTLVTKISNITIEDDECRDITKNPINYARDYSDIFDDSNYASTEADRSNNDQKNIDLIGDA